MPTKKRKFARRNRISNLSSTPSFTAQDDDATPSVAETNVESSLETPDHEPPHPYKRMRVAECRLNLLDRDDEIEQLKLALKASQQESLSKDATIAEKKASMQKMSKEAQASRREWNLLLAEQREANTLTAEEAEKKVAAARRDQASIVSKAKDDAAAQVLISIRDRDSKIAEAVLDKKRVLHAEREYCQDRRKESTAKVMLKLFAERVNHEEVLSKMEDKHEEVVALYQIDASKSKLTIQAQKKELSETNIKSKSDAREKQKLYSAQYQEKETSIKRLEKEYGSSVEVLYPLARNWSVDSLLLQRIFPSQTWPLPIQRRQRLAVLRK